MNSKPKPKNRFSKEKKRECINILRTIDEEDGFVYCMLAYLANDTEIDNLLEYIRSEEDITPEDVILFCMDTDRLRNAKE